MAQESWMNHPGFKNIDPLKQELLKSLASQSEGKSQKEMAPLLMATVAQANKKGISFNSDEMGLLIEIMKSDKTAEEKQQMDKMLNMITTMMKNRK